VIKVNEFNVHSKLLPGIFFLVFTGHLLGQKDTVIHKLPKHYFNTVISLDLYRKPEKNLPRAQPAARKLRTYGISQGLLSFYTPLYTKELEGWDSLSRGNVHLLLTGNYMSFRPEFAGLKDHNLIKLGIGLRFIYNTGKKGVWFFDAAPFLTRDVAFTSQPYLRLSSTVVYSHNSSLNFNWRIGITKSFLWGNRYYLPFIGLRIGRLDGVNFSVQIPRLVQLSIPVSRSFIVTIYSKAQGGVFNFSNQDTIYYKGPKATLHFARYEVNSGLRFDVRAGSHFNMYFAAGVSSQNNISFYSESANQSNVGAAYSRYVFTMNTPPTPFVDLGITLKFGKTRSIYGNKNMYDAIDMGNVQDGNSNIQIPINKGKLKDLNLESVRDLVDYNDF
jgi:hypothetical protein